MKVFVIILIVFYSALFLFGKEGDGRKDVYQKMTLGSLEYATIDCNKSFSRKEELKFLELVVLEDEIQNIGGGDSFEELPIDVILYSKNSNEYRINYKFRKSAGNLVMMQVTQDGFNLGFYSAGESYKYVYSKCFSSSKYFRFKKEYGL